MNVELLNRIWNQIGDHPQSWEQDEWIVSSLECGTAACISGWACLLSGYRPVFSTHPTGWRRRITTSTVCRGWKVGWVDDVALSLLDLDHHTARWLFHADRTYDDIKGFVDYVNRESS